MYNKNYSNAIIEKACEMLVSGYSTKEVCLKLNIDNSYIYSIIHKKVRQNITSKYNFPKKLMSGPKNPIPEIDKIKIRKMYNDKISLKSIFEFYNKYSTSKILHAIYD